MSATTIFLVDDLGVGRGADARTLAAPLASYVRSIVAGNAPVDRHDAGDDTALDELQRRGLALFR